MLGFYKKTNITTNCRVVNGQKGKVGDNSS